MILFFFLLLERVYIPAQKVYNARFHKKTFFSISITHLKVEWRNILTICSVTTDQLLAKLFVPQDKGLKVWNPGGWTTAASILFGFSIDEDFARHTGVRTEGQFWLAWRLRGHKTRSNKQKCSLRQPCRTIRNWLDRHTAFWALQSHTHTFCHCFSC